MAKYEIDLTGLTATDTTSKIDGMAVTFATDAATTAGNFVTAYNADDNKNYTASVNGNKIVLTAKSAGAVANAPAVEGTFTDMTAAAEMVETTEG